MVWWCLIAQPGFVQRAAYELFIGEPFEFSRRDRDTRWTFRNSGWSRWRFGGHEAIVSVFPEAIVELVLVAAVLLNTRSACCLLVVAASASVRHAELPARDPAGITRLAIAPSMPSGRDRRELAPLGAQISGDTKGNAPTDDALDDVRPRRRKRPDANEMHPPDDFEQGEHNAQE